jgi:hypothetical protein
MLIMCVIVGIIVFLTKCVNDQTPDKTIIKNPKGASFAGSAACASCHKNISESHRHTAHFLTSQPAKASYIKGSFNPGENTFILNDRVHVVMEKRKDSFYQVAYLDGSERQANSIDIVIGSGTKGQTYLDWSNNALFQLPVSYFSLANQWTNSPGYPGMIVYNRPISSRCLECHSTYVEKVSSAESPSEEFNREKILYGVDCEKCHGPAASHIEFQSKHPEDTIGKYIINPANLSRKQNLDLCAMCHGGRLRKTKPSFTFAPGDKLEDYFSQDSVGRHTADIDVHGNQYGLLAASKCFKMSEMTCNSCHNVHENERGRLSIISQRCLSCHGNEHQKICPMTKTIGSSIREDCISCHMPKQTSRSITVLLQGSEIPTAAIMRTHLIKIYPDETKKILDSMKSRGTTRVQ